MQQREVFLDAGFRVAARLPLAQAGIAHIVQEARLPAQAFEQLFGDLEDYLHGLQRQLAEDAGEAVLAAMNREPDNARRVVAGARAILDGALRQRGAMKWIIEACSSSASLRDSASRHEESLAMMLASGFAAAGSPQPQTAARLLMAALLETLRCELAAGHALPELRRAALALLRADISAVAASGPSTNSPAESPTRRNP